MSRAEEEILYEVEQHVATITLNRPHRANALAPSTIHALVERIRQAEADDDVRVLVLQASGDRFFCAGIDLKEIAVKEGDAYPHPMKDANRTVHEVLLEMGKPTIAAVNGVAAGAGAELALACDLRVAVQEARFCQPEAKIGMGANFASVVLPTLIPRAIALELLYTGRMLHADEALRIGLLNQVCSQESFQSDVTALARSIAANAPLSVRKIKETASRSLGLSICAGLRLNVGPNCYASEDRAEGAKAFLEKRAPVFQGR